MRDDELTCMLKAKFYQREMVKYHAKPLTTKSTKDS